MFDFFFKHNMMKTAVKRLTCNVVTVDGKFYGKFCLDRQRCKIKNILDTVISKFEKDINPLNNWIFSKRTIFEVK